jgi:two-component system response regulator FixJ
MADDLVAIIDDDEAVRQSTLGLLKKSGIDAVAFASGDLFLDNAKLDGFSCILLDIRMPGRDGLSILRELRKRQEPPPVVVITGHGDIAVAVGAMRLGAVDFMEKPYEPSDLLRAIQGAFASRSQSQDFHNQRRDAVALVAKLSKRQRQVLKGVLRGEQNKIIAFGMGLSIRTVEAYRAQLLEKLGVRSTAEAVRIAIGAGLLED